MLRNFVAIVSFKLLHISLFIFLHVFVISFCIFFSCNLWVSKLAPNVSAADIKTFFSSCGQVSDLV